MMEGGFYQQKRMSPTGIVVVVLLHGAALTALLTAKGVEFTRIIDPPLVLHPIPVPPPPPPPPPPQANRNERPDKPQVESHYDSPKPPVDLPPMSGPTTFPEMADLHLPDLPIGSTTVLPPPPPPVHEPVRIDSRIDSASALQPPYPSSAQREGAEGTVQVRVTIGADGKVKSVEKVRASREDFYAATERQALRYWRFKPATLDGKPIESSKVMTVHFQLNDLG